MGHLGFVQCFVVVHPTSQPETRHGDGNNAVRIMLIIHPIVQSGVGIVALEEAAKSLQCKYLK